MGRKKEKSSETMQKQRDDKPRTTYKHENENVPERNKTKIEQTLQNTHIKRQNIQRDLQRLFRFAP